MKWFSRKLFVFLLISISGIVLKAFNNLGDWPFVVLEIVTTVVYLFVQGNVNIEKLKSIKSNGIEIDLGGQK